MEAANFTPVPEDWQVVITDVRGSTKAIEAGKYKEVNTVAALCIAAVLNIAREKQIEIPYVFGGDGVTLVIPPDLVDAAKDSLLATQSLARNAFNLDLRVAMVPVRDIMAAGHLLSIAKIGVAQGYSQAAFQGTGLAVAESWVKGYKDTTSRKGNKEDEEYALQTDSTEIPLADYTGFECRWNDIPSPHEEIVTLLVNVREGRQPDSLTQKRANNLSDNFSHNVYSHNSYSHNSYKEILDTIERIYGDETARHPLQAKQLQLAHSAKQLRAESAVRQTSVLRLQILTLMGRFSMHFGVKVGAMEWGNYKANLIATTDFQKIDGVLRMVLSGTQKQRAELERELETRHQSGEIFYGIHVSQAALMTCLVFAYDGEQVHFVDGAEGGYALAAQSLKAQQ